MRPSQPRSSRRAVDELVPEGERRWVLASLEPLVGLVAGDVGFQRPAHRARSPGGGSSSSRSPSVGRSSSCRRPALGRRRPPRLRRRARRPRRGCAAPRRRVREARAARAPAGLGWRQAQRARRSRSVRSPSDETARLVESLLGRDPADEAFRATVVERCGRESALRRGVRPRSRRRAATSRAFPTACSGSSRRGSTSCRPPRRSSSATPR